MKLSKVEVQVFKKMTTVKKIGLTASLILISTVSMGLVVKDPLVGKAIEFWTNPAGTSTKQAEVASSGSKLQVDNITNLAGSGAPNFPNGASGITASVSDFNISAITHPNATVAGVAQPHQI